MFNPSCFSPSGPWIEPHREQPLVEELQDHGHIGEIWVFPPIASVLMKHSQTFCNRIFGHRACSVPPDYPEALTPQRFQGLCALPLLTSPLTFHLSLITSTQPVWPLCSSTERPDSLLFRGSWSCFSLLAVPPLLHVLFQFYHLPQICLAIIIFVKAF